MATWSVRDVLILACFVAFGCSSASNLGTNDAGAAVEGGQGGADADPTGPSPSCQHPASQPLSAPCCVEQGVDACGAGLFCAAFDGRRQATCYPNRSRVGGETCTADVQCLSNVCDAGGACRAAPGERCSPNIGCGTAIGSDDVFFCDPVASGGPSCRPCVSTSADPVCVAKRADAGPPVGICPPQCTTDTDCQATCPAIAGTVQCCAASIGQCYAFKGDLCPPPPR